MNQFRVIAEELNVRSKPTLAHDTVVGRLQKDDVVDQLDVSGDGYWYKVRRPADGLEGWSAHKYLVRAVNGAEADEPRWLTIARGEIGQKEFPGIGNNNPRILQYLRSTTLPRPENSRDETHWCSAFVNWCMEQAGFTGTDSAWARSWEHWGRRLERPHRGCIAVFTREGGGHVGFYMGETATHIRVLGGNQDDAVNEMSYPKARLLGYRAP